MEVGGVKITTFIPLRFKRRGYKKVVVGPVGVDDLVVINPPEPAISPSLGWDEQRKMIDALG